MPGELLKQHSRCDLQPFRKLEQSQQGGVAPTMLDVHETADAQATANCEFLDAQTSEFTQAAQVHTEGVQLRVGRRG